MKKILQALRIGRGYVVTSSHDVSEIIRNRNVFLPCTRAYYNWWRRLKKVKIILKVRQEAIRQVLRLRIRD